MPARRRYINPTTGDYELAAGGFREDMTPASRVVLRLRMRRGTVVGLPRFGSRLHEIRKLTADAEALARTFVLEALDDLIRAGELPGLDVSADVSGSSLHIVIAYRDPEGRKRSIPYLHRVSL